MTNGEKIQTILDVDRDCTEVHGKNGTMTFTVTQDFWDAEYKEPTQKTCKTCRNFGSHVGKCDICHKFSLWTEKEPISSEKPNKSEIPTSSTPKNDLGVVCVSRQEVLRLLANSIGKTNTYLQTEVLKMPSVTPREPRKGHWISHREHCEINNLLPSGLGSYFWCSECDCGIDSKDFARVNYNYCPNCGAKMKGEG